VEPNWILICRSRFARLIPPGVLMIAASYAITRYAYGLLSLIYVPTSVFTGLVTRRTIS
jgi:hypothetical protein